MKVVTSRPKDKVDVDAFHKGYLIRTGKNRKVERTAVAKDSRALGTRLLNTAVKCNVK